MARVGISMEARGNESTTSNAPTFRDLQVSAGYIVLQQSYVSTDFMISDKVTSH